MDKLLLYNSLALVALIPAWFFLSTSSRTQTSLYQILSGFIAFFTLLTAVASSNPWIAVFAIVPVTFAVLVRPLFVHVFGRANVVDPVSLPRVGDLGLVERVLYFAISLFLTGLVFIVIALVVPLFVFFERATLATGLTLILLGMLSWMTKKDLISQAIALLVMDHGLFLVGDLVATTRPDLDGILIATLFIYLVVPLTWLLIVLPSLQKISNGLAVDQYTELQG